MTKEEIREWNVYRKDLSVYIYNTIIYSFIQSVLTSISYLLQYQDSIITLENMYSNGVKNVFIINTIIGQYTESGSWYVLEAFFYSLKFTFPLFKDQFQNNTISFSLLDQIITNIQSFNNPITLFHESINFIGYYSWYIERDFNSFTTLVSYVLTTLKSNQMVYIYIIVMELY